jgi:WhiB family redox-sensing transcriptional regulator
MTTIDTTHLDELEGLNGLDGLDELDDREHARARARCSDGNATLVAMFFSDDEFDIARAKAICARCGLRRACLSGALERREAYGVWGGELLVDGAVVAVKRGRGRPPKHPRPVLIVDEVPIPPHLVA